jgi:hypothetical protein
MEGVRDDVHHLVSQFANDWLGSDEWASLRALPKRMQLACLNAALDPEASGEPLPKRLGRLAGELSPCSALSPEAVNARIACLLVDLAQGAVEGETPKIVKDFVDEFLSPHQCQIHSFTLAEFHMGGLGQSTALVDGWWLHQRTLPLEPRALPWVCAPGFGIAPTSLTRKAQVPKGCDPNASHAESWASAQLVLEGIRLFVQSGVFFAQEDFSSDYPYAPMLQFLPPGHPAARGSCYLQAERLEELRAFLGSWLPLGTLGASEAPRQSERNRLHQAQWQLMRAFGQVDWERALVDAVGGLEGLLVGGGSELSYRLAVRTGHLLSAHNPEEAGRVFSDIKHIYNVRSKVAHGDWTAAAGLAAKHWGEKGQPNEAAGRACASTAIDYLRKAILAAAYFASKGKDIETEIDETSLLNVAAREALRKSLEDTANPLIRALMA